MKVLMAIDGACRRNGKPDCTSAGGLFLQVFDDDNQLTGCGARAVHEYGSTNQRGELMALLEAMKIIWDNGYHDVSIVTDSEYLFNAMTKQWYINWLHNDWLTRDGYPVKNRDIWEKIAGYAGLCDKSGLDIVFYHIKGHCIPFGAVTATRALEEDPVGRRLLGMVSKKFSEVLRAGTKAQLLEKASALSLKNNGFALDIDGPVLKRWVVANVMADAIATKAVEEADSRRET